MFPTELRIVEKGQVIDFILNPGPGEIPRQGDVVKRRDRYEGKLVTGVNFDYGDDFNPTKIEAYVVPQTPPHM